MPAAAVASVINTARSMPFAIKNNFTISGAT
jgi:hypothetical protein